MDRRTGASLMDEVEYGRGVFAAAGVERVAGEADAGAAAAKVHAKNANAFRAQLLRAAEHIARLVAAAEAVDKDGDRIVGQTLLSAICFLADRNVCPTWSVVVEGDGVAIGEGDVVEDRANRNAVGKKGANNRLQVSAADERVRAEGRQVQWHEGQPGTGGSDGAKLAGILGND
jgi:hypothetical protein